MTVIHNANKLLAYVDRSGGKVFLESGKLRYRLPSTWAAKPDQAASLLEQLRQNKTAILEILQPEGQPRNPWNDLLDNLEPIYQELETRDYPLTRARWFANGLEVLAAAKRVRTLAGLKQVILEAHNTAGDTTDHASLLTRADDGQDVVLAGFSKATWAARRRVVTA